MGWWAVYGRLAATFGWSFAEIDLLSMWDLSDINKYLQHNPPLHEMIGDYFGARKQAAEAHSSRMGTKEELKRIANQWRGPGG